MRFEPAGGSARRVPLTPLIDVVFLLLIFFMLASRFLDLGAVAVDAGEAESTLAVGDALRVDLLADGRVEVAGAAVARDAVESTLRGLLGGRAEPAVIVAPDAAAPVEAVVGLLDAARRAGAEPLTLVRRAAASGG